MVIRLSACSIGNVRGGGPGVGEITINTGILGVYLREAEGLAAQMAVFPVLLLWSHRMYDVVFKGIPCTKKGLARGRSRFTGGCHPENIFCAPASPLVVLQEHHASSGPMAQSAGMPGAGLVILPAWQVADGAAHRLCQTTYADGSKNLRHILCNLLITSIKL